jgi:hypothetical protein
MKEINDRYVEKDLEKNKLKKNYENYDPNDRFREIPKHEEISDSPRVKSAKKILSESSSGKNAFDAIEKEQTKIYLKNLETGTIGSYHPIINEMQFNRNTIEKMKDNEFASHMVHEGTHVGQREQFKKMFKEAEDAQNELNKDNKSEKCLLQAREKAVELDNRYIEMEFEAFKAEAELQRELNNDPNSIHDVQETIFNKDGTYRRKTDVLVDLRRRYPKNFEKFILG